MQDTCESIISSSFAVAMHLMRCTSSRVIGNIPLSCVTCLHRLHLQ